MAKILAVGIATLDIINLVDSYPSEDTEVRALSQRKLRGGQRNQYLGRTQSIRASVSLGWRIS